LPIGTTSPQLFGNYTGLGVAEYLQGDPR